MQQGQRIPQVVTAKTNHLLASGMSQGEAAQQLGISRKSANKISQAKKAEIEQLALQYIQDSIPLIRSNNPKTLQIAKHVLNKTKTAQGQGKRPEPDIEAIESAKTILTLADKKEYRALLTMGIVPSHTQSLVVNNIYNQTLQVVSPQVLDLLQSRQEDVIDVELDIPGEGEGEVTPCNDRDNGDIDNNRSKR